MVRTCQMPILISSSLNTEPSEVAAAAPDPALLPLFDVRTVIVCSDDIIYLHFILYLY